MSERMTRFAAAMLVVLAPVVGATPLQGGKKTQSVIAPKKTLLGTAIDPKAKLMELDRKTRTLKDLRGAPLVLVFWSADCPVSSAYAERLNALSATYTEKGVQFVVVDPVLSEYRTPGRKEGDYIREKVREQGLKLPVMLDIDLLKGTLGVTTTPYAFLLDEKGKLRYAGGIDNDPKLKKAAEDFKAHLAPALDELLAGKEITRPLTKPKGTPLKVTSPGPAAKEAGQGQKGKKGKGEKSG